MVTKCCGTAVAQLCTMMLIWVMRGDKNTHAFRPTMLPFFVTNLLAFVLAKYQCC